ncbi:8-amino-7-oxononanoate synthase [Kitasatospora gansuensis]|uniref:8-amino-7-oxononanoate synthase n=1 Tax=Kitasatospora gansuensis TaxID=258050 RepID=A0A7W7WES6_9ACTN|nr:aminotransferase class I/II-fold pyridoxal phosphate-dependent enzyme [Kitasatospora gansuensis]MBB4945087.1 8-amino-7-oxononanoate synthase [Kitasatospora gansuensis]
MAAGLYPYFLPLTGHEGTTVTLGDQELVMCGSNNYLGLTSDPRVKKAAAEALDLYGTSCTGSRFLNGNLALHDLLEAELADFYGKPAAAVFSTGYQANLGVISALAGRHDMVFADSDAHASIVDGSVLSGAKLRRFRHNDADALGRRLAAAPEGAGRLVVVDGVYSMEGDLCALPELVATSRRYGARIVVDDAHGLGVLDGGRGTTSYFGLTDQVDLITVTFSKSLASLGGAVVGSEEVVHFLKHHARSLIFSASATPASAAAALAALRILRAEPWRAERAQENADYIRRGLARLGVSSGASSTPVVPLRTRGVVETLLLWRRLVDRGVYTNPVLPPAASPRLRLSFMATHTTDHLDRVLEALAAEADMFLGADEPDGSDETAGLAELAAGPALASAPHRS